MSAFGGKADIPPPWTVEELEFWPSSVVVLSRNIGTSAMAARTVELDRNDLDKSIEVLSSAAQALRLTRFKSLSYRALMLSVDVATVTFVIIIIIAIIKVFFTQPPVDAPSPPSLVIQVLTAVFGVSIGVGIVSLVLNIPLFVRVFRERARLKKLGLSSLSRSLWIESRRSRWISRARSYLLIGVGMVLALFAAGLLIEPMTLSPPTWQVWIILVSPALFCGIIATLLLAARYLRDQRERMDLTANAEELRKAFQSLRQRAGDVEVVTVPSELLEQTAKIETAQIANERKDAVLQSITSPSQEYPIAFDRGAAEQRAMLSIADRIELEDLVEQLSAGAGELESQAEGGATAALRAATTSKRVEIDYLINQASHRIHITAVRQGVSGSKASANGASHA